MSEHTVDPQLVAAITRVAKQAVADALLERLASVQDIVSRAVERELQTRIDALPKSMRQWAAERDGHAA